MIPKAKKGIKNDKGDYIVTGFVIEDTRTGMKKKGENNDNEEDEDDSDEFYGDEDDKKEETKKEATPVKGKYQFYIEIFYSHTNTF